MANLTIENLNGIVQGGNTSELFSGGSRVAPDLKTGETMRQEGVEPTAAGDSGKTFADILHNSFDKVNEMQHQADQAIGELVSGRTKNIHETMLAVERADTSLKLAMQVRNKILDAYREIMRMQV